MNETNKPKIWAHCAAGCKWETVHYSDFEKSAAYIRQYPNTEGSYSLDVGKNYKIFAPKNQDGNFECLIKYFYLQDGGTEPDDLTHEITFKNNDKYAQAFIFCLLDAFESGDYKDEITLVYELAGVRYTETIGGENIAIGINQILIEGATDVLLFNSTATLTGEKGDKGDPYTLTDEDKKTIVSEVLKQFADVSKDWQTITFKIDQATYTAMQGMSWHEWCQTDEAIYDKENNLKYECNYDEDSVVGAEGLYVYKDNDGMEAVLCSDLIIPNHNYILI